MSEVCELVTAAELCEEYPAVVWLVFMEDVVLISNPLLVAGESLELLNG